VMAKGDWARRPVGSHWVKGKHDLAAGLRPAAMLRRVVFPDIQGGKNGCAIGGQIEGKDTSRRIAWQARAPDMYLKDQPVAARQSPRDEGAVVVGEGWAPAQRAGNSQQTASKKRGIPDGGLSKQVRA
jgi:hypothetical protein